MNRNPTVKQIILPAGLLVIAVVISAGFVSALRAITSFVPAPIPVATPTLQPIDEVPANIDQHSSLLDINSIEVNTSDWQTYNNGEIEFQYPDGWFIFYPEISEYSEYSNYVAVRSKETPKSSAGFAVFSGDVDELAQIRKKELQDTTIHDVTLREETLSNGKQIFIIESQNSLGSLRILIGGHTEKVYEFSIEKERPMEVFIGMIRTFMIL